MNASAWTGTIMATALVAGLLAGAAASVAPRAQRASWCLVAVATALLGIQRGLGWQLPILLAAKAFARQGGWYEGRGGMQIAMLALLAAVGAIGAVLIARAGGPRSPPLRLATAAVAAFALFTLANIVSLHGWDQVINRPVAGIVPWVWIELGLSAAVAAAALAVLLAPRARSR